MTNPTAWIGCLASHNEGRLFTARGPEHASWTDTADPVTTGTTTQRDVTEIPLATVVAHRARIAFIVGRMVVA